MSFIILFSFSLYRLLFLSSLLTTTLSSITQATEEKKVYIVYMGEKSDKAGGILKSLHKNLLNRIIPSNGGTERLIHSYTRSFNAFAARLSEEEAEELSSMKEVVSIFPNQKRSVHTTRSWDFIGFPLRAARSEFESDVIIGMLDTGIWPESPSFNGEGIGPPPGKWKGVCQASDYNFTCNNKIIGARYYIHDGDLGEGDIASPHDTYGHGTHTSSIAAGRIVPNTSLSGLAEGTARGGAPSARLAVYKVCWHRGSICYDVDTLAAFDDAIADGVDIISMSIGHTISSDYFLDAFAIGSFHATKNGILVVSSAGNSGPKSYSVQNVAPWMLTVAASTTDRKFVTQVKLGNGDVYQGDAVNTYGDKDTFYPLIDARNVPNKTAGFQGYVSRFCDPGSLDGNLSMGSILICDKISNGSGPHLVGAVGVIMPGKRSGFSALSFQLSSSLLGLIEIVKIQLYSYQTSHPKASISKSVGLFDHLAPYVTPFSSRGPNPITYNLLKPDLAAPGVEIIAAWTPGFNARKSSMTEIISGTSMACPHVSGSAAYIKSFKPTWSPAAIKSALMTTAFTMSQIKNTDAEFAYGAGLVNPLKALHPGLVYDVDEVDYIKFLCGQGYNTKTLRLLTGDSSNCTEKTNGTIFDLNYPTFALSIIAGKPYSATFHRIVTNVGGSNSTYIAKVVSPSGLSITIKPQVLSFHYPLEKKSFMVKLKGQTDAAILSGNLVWSDGIHNVRSPIIVYTT